jgi:hypothetical protein
MGAELLQQLFKAALDGDEAARMALTDALLEAGEPAPVAWGVARVLTVQSAVAQLGLDVVVKLCRLAVDFNNTKARAGAKGSDL